MTYTEEEQKQIEDKSKIIFPFEDEQKERIGFKHAFQSSIMKAIIESRIKQAKIDMLEEISKLKTEIKALQDQLSSMGLRDNY